MNEVTMPQYMTPSAIDAAIIGGILPTFTYHCLGCGVFGWGWVRSDPMQSAERCPCCGGCDTEELTVPDNGE